jgi:hypothetical protein
VGPSYAFGEASATRHYFRSDRLANRPTRTRDIADTAELKDGELLTTQPPGRDINFTFTRFYPLNIT